MFSGHYQEWRQRRLAWIVGKLGADWVMGKRVLELGAGRGHVGEALRQLGAKVTCVEGRASHVEEGRRLHPGLEFVQMDLDREFPDGRWDLVVNMGLLYHVRDWRSCLRKTLALSELAVVESEVVDSSAVVERPSVDDPSGYDQGMSRDVWDFSAAAVEAEFAACGFRHERARGAELDTPQHRYNDPIEETGLFREGRRAMWICRRDHDAPVLPRPPPPSAPPPPPADAPRAPSAPLRVALCLSGHVRRFERTLPTLWRHVLAGHEVDVFASTVDVRDFHGDPEPVDLLELERHLGGRTVRLQVERTGSSLVRCPESTVAQMFRRVRQADELRRASGLEHDLVVRARFDHLWSDGLDLGQFTAKPWDVVSFPDTDEAGGNSHGGLCDQLWVARPAAMATVCDSLKFLGKERPHPETWLLSMFGTTGLRAEHFHMPCRLRG